MCIELTVVVMIERRAETASAARDLSILSFSASRSETSDFETALTLVMPREGARATRGAEAREEARLRFISIV